MRISDWSSDVCSSDLAAKGRRSWNRMVRAPPHDRVTPLALISRLASSGVSAMPSRFEKDALHTAAAILPRAIEVKAIDDCTVDGSKVRNRKDRKSTRLNSSH